MQELTNQDLHDYANHFNALISWTRLGMPIDEFRLKMPHEYLKNKYPERYRKYLLYPDSFEHKRLQLIIEYFNQQIQKTKTLLQRLLKIVGEIIYGNPDQFIQGMV